MSLEVRGFENDLRNIGIEDYVIQRCPKRVRRNGTAHKLVLVIRAEAILPRLPISSSMQFLSIHYNAVGPFYSRQQRGLPRGRRSGSLSYRSDA